MSRTRYVRDWRLPPGWRPVRDTGVLGDGGAPLFADPWGVLEPAGGEVSVAVLDPAVLPALPPGRRPGERRPPTLLLERRALTRPPGRARQQLRTPPPAPPGQPVAPGHRTVESPHGPAALLSTRPWDAGTGPDVRVVAVVVPKWSADAVVLTLTWDDEAGLPELERLVERLLADLTIVTEEPGPADPAASRGRSRSAVRGDDGELAPDRGARRAGVRAAAAGGLTRLARRVLGPRTFRRATALTWLTLAAVVAAYAFTGGWHRDVLLLLTAVVAVLVPALLAWRAWTAVHGLVAHGRAARDPEPVGARRPEPAEPRQPDRAAPREPDPAAPRELVPYLLVAVLLGAVLLGPTAGSGAAPWHLEVAAWLDLGAHAALLLLEAAPVVVPRLRARALHGRRAEA